MINRIRVEFDNLYKEYKESKDYKDDFEFLAMIDKVRKQFQYDLFPNEPQQLVDDVMLFNDI